MVCVIAPNQRTSGQLSNNKYKGCNFEVQRLVLDLSRNLRRRHDHCMLINKLYTFGVETSLDMLLKNIFIYVVDNSVNEKSLPDTTEPLIGGGGIRRSSIWKANDLQQYLTSNQSLPTTASFKYVAHTVPEALTTLRSRTVLTNIPFNVLVPRLLKGELQELCKQHGKQYNTRSSIDYLQQQLVRFNCEDHITAFKLVEKHTKRENKRKDLNKSVNGNKSVKGDKSVNGNKSVNVNSFNQPNVTNQQPDDFPPQPVSHLLKEQIITDFCQGFDSKVISEKGCAVCGMLTLSTEMTPLQNLKSHMKVLTIANRGLTRVERFSSAEPIRELKGPILDRTCTHVCNKCKTALKKDKIPRFALANGTWIGTVPLVLQNLSFAEKLLISRVFYSNFIMRVSSGQKKMKANVVLFAKSMPKVFAKLPPPREEIDEVLAFIYIGPTKPGPKEWARIPLLIRRNKVGHALEWLKLNHEDYHDLEIDYKTLATYPEDSPTVAVEYCKSDDGTKQAESSAKYDNEEEGVTDGHCSFAVHGLTGEHLVGASTQALKAMALKHVESENSKMLGIGHAEFPESIFDNPQLYPGVFPWLFPYGLGGFKNNRGQLPLSEVRQKRQYLMYHDKRFQLEPSFSLLAFNHEQIKKSATGGYLLTKRANFPSVCRRLLNLNQNAFDSILEKMTSGERIKVTTPQEKACFEVLNDIDHVASHVQGSQTQKKYMRNEIWSLISYLGAPSWFITFSPVDQKHPVCLYFADTKEEFKPDLNIYTSSQAHSMICDNPVAGARFFNIMVTLFIKHVLGVQKDHPGLFGNTSGYYGTVEQQGRLTLHMHMLLWLRGALSPREIRRRILDPESDFQQKIVQYLEETHQGEFLTGTMEDMKTIRQHHIDNNAPDPATQLPHPPPSCKCKQEHSVVCVEKKKSWWSNFQQRTDLLLYLSNVHSCMVNKCKTKSSDHCKARFPRETHIQTLVDTLTGAITLKKGEAWLNTVSPIVTYLLGCNTDITSLLSGTAVKAVVAYVTDYITKSPLKSHVIFDVIKGVFSKNSEMLSGDLKQHTKAKRLLTQIVNSLTSKMELGAPMAAMYLLQHPDHYTDHQFKTFYWKSYVNEVLQAWEEQLSDCKQANDESKVVLNKASGEYVGYSPVDDYVYRPKEFESLTLYDWVRVTKKIQKRTSKTKVQAQEDLDDDQDMDDNKEGWESPSNDEDEDDFEQQQHNLKVKGKTEYQFKSEHPQAKSHKIIRIAENRCPVPNFIGSLPRPDQGNREYYCATMLTLFKPWRSGKVLKTDIQTWDEAFTSIEFTSRQHEIMGFLNLKYECLDARDDYSVQRKNSEDRSDILRFMGNSEVIDELDASHTYDQILNDVVGEDFIASLENILENATDSTMRLNRAMMEIENVMRRAGWLDIIENQPCVENSQAEFVDGHLKTAAQWHDILITRKQEILSNRTKQAENAGRIPRNRQAQPHVEANAVKIVNKAYLDKTFRANSLDDQTVIEDTITKFQLNKEQERAFRIVANHATNRSGEQLKMYLGGMAGTGKSQVIKSLVHFFNERKESFRFLIVAPTGGAAALISGSTYHSVFGFARNKVLDSLRALTEIYSKIEMLDLILLDEISMVDCIDFFNISSQASLAMNVKDQIFGGKSIVVAGDFAQLPPAGHGKRPLYGRTAAAAAHHTNSDKIQKATLGKAIWHQFTTVVILRQNMRQQNQSLEDKKFRTLLQNLRYKSCTNADINYLRTRITGREESKPKLINPQFKYVSVITGRNAHRDRINQLGTIRFAEDHNRKLTTFVSRDVWKDYSEKESTIKSKVVDPLRSTDVIAKKVQDMIWNIPHHLTENHPGKLDLCIGLPVMIKKNEATECAVTNGAEATVAGWKSLKIGNYDVLETLFLELTNPPIPIKLSGLPQNVVPIPTETENIKCELPNGNVISISRQQTPVIQNFAMTDYCSQGRTRPCNVVDPNNCRSHQSLYTCLSRGSTSEGTILVQGFDEKKLQGGISGFLRQEFRELEILDEITKLRYNKKLNHTIVGETRAELIKNFRVWKGMEYVPKAVHNSLRWSATDPFPPTENLDWKTSHDKLDKNMKETTKLTEKGNYVPALGTRSLQTVNDTKKIRQTKRKVENEQLSTLGKKMKVSDIQKSGDPTKSKSKQPIEAEQLIQNLMDLSFDAKSSFQANEQNVQTRSNNHTLLPKGFLWRNMSCAYDSILTILRNIWTDNPTEWSNNFRTQNDSLASIQLEFTNASQNSKSWDEARDDIRKTIVIQNGRDANSGNHGTDVMWLIQIITQVSTDTIIETRSCESCGTQNRDESLNSMFWKCDARVQNQTVSQYLQSRWNRTHHRHCQICQLSLHSRTQFKTIPALLALEVIKVTGIQMEHHFHIKTIDNVDHQYRLAGIIYFGSYHFTSRIIKENGTVWYNDGITTGQDCRLEGSIQTYSWNNLRQCYGKSASVVIYSRC